MKKLFRLLILSAVVLAINTSCSSDDSEYNSRLPMFSDITADKDVIYTNEEVEITAIQSKIGQLLYSAEYKWYLDNESNCFSSNVATYDKKPANPSCKMKAPENPGKYTIIFKGEYKFSGKAGNGGQSGTIKTPDGKQMSVTEEFYPLKGVVTLKKDFMVYKKVN